MIFQEKEIILKNGVKAILKTPEPEDAKQLLSTMKKISRETDFISKYEEDWERMTVEDEKKWIESSRNSDSHLVISCYAEGKIIGNCDIIFNTLTKTSHRAAIGIALLRQFHGIGLGSAAFEELLSAARAHEGTEIVELEYVSDNERGKALYEKFGFENISVRPKVFKLKDGTYQDIVYMQKKL